MRTFSLKIDWSEQISIAYYYSYGEMENRLRLHQHFVDHSSIRS